MPQTATSAGQGSTDTAPPMSAPLWRRVFQGSRQRSRPATDSARSIRPFYSLAASPSSNKPLLVPSEPELAHMPSFQMTPTVHSSNDVVVPPEEPKPPKWSVVYQPEVEKRLDLHLALSFAYDFSVNCVKMSPDGQRIAVGGSGNAYLNELQTGSNIWSVCEPFSWDSN